MRKRVAVIVVVLSLIAAAAAASSSSSSHHYTASFTFALTSQGTQSGQTVSGEGGHGSFSATLRSGAAFVAATMAAATGVPYGAYAKGGSYADSFSTDAHGSEKGLIAAKLSSSGLGQLCVSFTTKQGAYTPGQSFVPTTAALTIIGGTGTSARLHATITGTLTSLTGASVEQFMASALANATLGSPRGMSAACRALVAHAS